MVLPKARKVNKNHKNTGIHLSQQIDDKKDKKLEKTKWAEQKKVKSFTRREFTE